MNRKHLLGASLLSAMIAVSLAGCSKKSEMSKSQVEYLSHMDQARFFQKQGELKASMQEAKGAIRLKPNEAAPYLLIVDNLLISGDADNAIQELEQIQSHLGKDLPPSVRNQVVMDFAKAEMRKQNYAAALSQLKKFDESGKISSPQLTAKENLLGEILLAQRDLAGAKQSFQSALKTDPKSVNARIGLSKVAYQQNDKPEAQKQLDTALKEADDNSEAWLWKAQMAEQEKDYATSEEAYMKALDGIGKYDIMTYEKYQTMSSLINVLRAEGKIQQAYVYQEILAKSAPGIVINNLKTAIKAYQEGDLDEAGKDLEEVLKQAPGNRKAALLLGMIRFQQGKVREARDILNSQEQQGGSLETSKLLAATQIRLGQSQQAKKMLEQLKGADNDPGVLALVGIAAIGTGEPEVGRQYIEKSLALKPDNASLRVRYATWLVSIGDFKTAITQTQEAIKTQPDLVPARRLEIEAYLRSNQPQQALDAARQWNKQQPHNVSAMITKGDIEAALKHTDTALTDYRLAAKTDPKSPAPEIAMGNLMRQQGNDSEAMKHYENAISLSPDNHNALTGLMQVATQSKEQLGQAIQFLHKKADQNPTAVGPRVILMENALMEGNFSDSEALADKIQALAQHKDETNQFIASAYARAALHDLQTNNADKAVKIIKLAQKRFPDNMQTGLLHARILFLRNKEQEAMEALSQLKKVHPDSEQPYLLEADYRASNQQYDQAIDLYKLALQKAGDPVAYIRLANVETRAGQPDKAVDTLEKAAQEYPDAPGVILQLGLAYQAVKKADKAEQAYQKVLKLNPDQPVALNNLAFIYQEKGDKRAEETAKRAYDLQPKSGPIADTYGWILYNNGKVKESIPVLESAHSLAPQVKEISLHLAQAYKSSGQADKAKALLEKF